MNKIYLNNNFTMVVKLLQIDGVTDIDRNDRIIIYLNKKHESIEKLKAHLNNINCFNFYSTNSGKNIIGLSQILYYINTGYKAYLNRYTVNANEHEIHHINGDICDNRSNNLILLSSYDHHLVTSFQRASIKQLANFDIASFKSNWLSKYEDAIPTPFNNQGKSIKNHKHSICNVIAKTILQTSKSEWLTKAAKRKIPIVEVNKLVQKYNPNKYDRFYKEQLLSEAQYTLQNRFKKAETILFAN